MIKKLKNKSLKQFLIKLLVFVAVLFIVDLLMGGVLKKLYFKQQSGSDYLTTYAIDTATADLFIFGSSRAENIFNPVIIEKQLGLSCYNAGRSGEPIFYHTAVLKSVLKRVKPSIILLSFDAGNFSKNQDSYDRIAVLLPYYQSHPEMRSIIELKTPFEKIKLISNLYPYNSSILSILSSFTDYNKKKYLHIKGFTPLTNTIERPFKNLDYSKEKELDSIKINTFKSFIRCCLSTNVQLYIVCTPYMINAIGTDASIIAAKKIAKEMGIHFFDYSRDTFYTQKPHLFADFRHLNNKGVDIFYTSIAERIRLLQ